MLWGADVSWHDRIGGLGKFHRLLVSWVLVLTPGLTWRGKDFGVPAKDYIFQSINLLICVFALLGFAGRMSDSCCRCRLVFDGNGRAQPPLTTHQP